MGKNLKGKDLGKGISQRRDGRYEGRYLDRFGQRQNVYANTLKDVRNKLKEAKVKNNEKKSVISPAITLDKWQEMWMKSYKEPVIRLTSKRIYNQIYFSKIQPVLGNKKISQITKIQVQELLNLLKQEGYSWETLNKVKLLLNDMFNRALEDEFLTRNPAKGVRNPINKPKNKIRALTRQEQEDFFECAMGTFYYNAFVVEVNTGLRPGEIFGLKENDLDFEQKKIHVQRTLIYSNVDDKSEKQFYFDPPKTAESNRFVPMNTICEKALLKQLMVVKIVRNRYSSSNKLKKFKQGEFKDLIFTTKFGTPINSSIYCDAIKRIVDEINLMKDDLEKMEYFGGHVFRHTFATRCFEAGISPKTVQSYLGHASIQMTMDLYTSVLEDKKKIDMELLEKTIDIKAPDVDDYDTNKVVPFRETIEKMA